MADVQVQSAGFLVFRQIPSPAFLLMQHATRWDLPKGHLDENESLKQCAIRELEEETGISADGIWIDPDFIFQHEYNVMTKRHPAPVRKRLTIYVAWLEDAEAVIHPTEHLGFRWFDWKPPHAIQAQTIDPLLEAAAAHFKRNPGRLGES